MTYRIDYTVEALLLAPKGPSLSPFTSFSQWYILARDLAHSSSPNVGILSANDFPMTALSGGGGQFAKDRFMKEI